MRAIAEQGNGRLPCKSTRPNANKKKTTPRGGVAMYVTLVMPTLCERT